ncbi:hypothetical protein BKA62DRAFT_705320, partial [Auriculariales sp. MPI-PUGE-AT-0066]
MSSLEPMHTIHPILDGKSSFSAEIPDTLRLIGSVPCRDPRYGERLARCQVVRVTHYRNLKEFSPHELVVLEVRYEQRSNAGEGVSHNRYLRLERFRKDSERSSNRLSSDMLSVSKKTQKADMIKVATSLDDILSGEYGVVREFDVPSEKLTVLEALVFADTLSTVSTSYSIIQMCQFWAINLFLVLQIAVSKRNRSAVSVRDGPAVRRAGKFHCFSLVNINNGRTLRQVDQSLAELCITAHDPSVDWTLLTSHRKDAGVLEIDSSPKDACSCARTVAQELRGSNFLANAEQTFRRVTDQIQTRCTEMQHPQAVVPDMDRELHPTSLSGTLEQARSPEKSVRWSASMNPQQRAEQAELVFQSTRR